MFRIVRSNTAFMGLVVAVLALVAGARTVQAQSEIDPFALSIEDLYKLKVDSVFAASKHQQSTLDAPSSVTIITGREIQRYGYRDLADVVRHVRGFFSTYDRICSY